MIIRLRKGATPEQLQEVVRRIEANGFRPDISVGVDTTVIGVLGNTQALDENIFTELEWVDAVMRITRPYKLVSREYNPQTRIIRIGDAALGDGKVVIMAGPCSVEERDQLVSLAEAVKKAGAQVLRGGAYKPRTSPYAFQGIGRPALEWLREAREITGLPVITEATGTHHHARPDGSLEDRSVLDLVVEHTDIVQIGTRNMKAYGLLMETGRRAGRAGKTVLLKRGESATMEEFLLAAEYLVMHGCPDVILCLRGIRTFESHKFQRYTSDLAAIPILKRESNLPVVFDPSHATGDRRLVHSVSLAAVAAGADGLLIEAHANPQAAWSDGQECVTPSQLEQIVDDVRRLEGLREPSAAAL